ncbi:hypothetical protein BDB00DRAFT_763761 [Zychaea mexicana]|uniref:uncharacterized protein n=1 Tax=Zychaea mexicana TaxID=64656 RepID=UPI0022FDDBD5|nr:uncharacterized protein BDB00DRAFT_763761 [Zychaea mexicana]KAI9493356.1 hypothetical protein BDB00DRAFT_763761 [Zychaea mexicana]
MGKKKAASRSQKQEHQYQKPVPPSGPLINRIPSQTTGDDDNIPEDEKLRILSQTGLMQQVKKREAEIAAGQAASQMNTSVYVWQALFMSIPFGFLLGAFDVTVRVQYSEPWSHQEWAIRALKSVPALFPLIYLTNRHRQKKLVQSIMAVGSALVGAFLLYTLRRTPSLGQMSRAPGLATIWIYFVVQLDLLPAVATLALVGFYWYFGLKTD